jgi:hypothetical protein
MRLRRTSGVCPIDCALSSNQRDMGDPFDDVCRGQSDGGPVGRVWGKIAEKCAYEDTQIRLFDQ